MKATEINYDEIYKNNPERDRVGNRLKENFTKEFEDYHRKFVTYINELRWEARRLNLPLSINPIIDGTKMFDQKGSTIVNQIQMSFLIGMIRESKSYEPDYL